MKKIHLVFACACALALSGCFTWHETAPVQVQMSQAPKDRETKLALSGFAATITEYVPVYGYQSYYVDGGPVWGRHGRRGCYPGHYETARTETLIPKIEKTEVFLRRAQNILEDNGFLLRAAPADYNVDVTFEGPFVSDDELSVEYAWMFCSVLSAEYSVQNWTAKLRIYDNKTGRVVFAREYAQKYDNVVWSPLFFIGLAGYTRNTYNYMQSWCLTALTDRTMADATAFLSSAK